MFIPPLPIDNFFFSSVCKTKGAVGAVCALLRIWPLSASWPITVLDGAGSLKGFHTMGDGWIFLKNRRTSFNKDLSMEPYFGRIHLVRQYL
jgi:hypothetical protein